MVWKIAMQINQGCVSHIGRRKNQQDAFGFSNFEDTLFIKHGGSMAVVCDGMGGLEKGEEAAHIAIKTILDCYMAKLPEISIQDALDIAIKKANEEVVKLGIETGNQGNIGTTLVVAVIYNDELFWRTVGDSRIYLLRDNKLQQLNIDHTYAQELLQNLSSNGMTLDEALNHQDGAALVSFLGIGENIKVDGNTHSSKLKVDDVLLICTDGLYNPLTEAELIESLQNSDAMKAAKDLQHKTLDKQFLTQDNLTGVVLRIQTDKNKKSCMRSIVKLALVCITLLTLMFLGYFLYKNLHLPVLKNQETKLQVLEQVIEVKPLSVIEQQLELANKFYEAKKFKEAIGLFKLLVDQGNARAQYKLGEMLDKGLGVKKDQKQAYIYYKKAADQGEKDAIKALKGKVDDSKNIKNNEPVKGVAQTDTNKVSKDIEPTKTKEK